MRNVGVWGMSDRQSKGQEETGLDEILGTTQGFTVARNQGETRRKLQNSGMERMSGERIPFLEVMSSVDQSRNRGDSEVGALGKRIWRSVERNAIGS